MKHLTGTLLIMTLLLSVKSFANQNILMEIPMDYQGCFDVVSIDGKPVEPAPRTTYIQQSWDPFFWHESESSKPRILEVWIPVTNKSFAIYTDDAAVSENSVKASFYQRIRETFMESRPDKYYQVLQNVNLVKFLNGNIKVAGNIEIKELERPFRSHATTVNYEFKKADCRF